MTQVADNRPWWASCAGRDACLPAPRAFQSSEVLALMSTPRKAPKDGGRLRLRITPQHFSSLGTTFRDVQALILGPHA